MAWTEHHRPPSEYIHPAKQRRILTAHAGMCHVCGHPDSDGVDHVTPWAEWTRTDLSPHDATNLAPIHHTPCPHCGAPCHTTKTQAEAARGRARAHARRQASGLRPSEAHPGATST